MSKFGLWCWHRDKTNETPALAEALHISIDAHSHRDDSVIIMIRAVSLLVTCSWWHYRDKQQVFLISRSAFVKTMTTCTFDYLQNINKLDPLCED